MPHAAVGRDSCVAEDAFGRLSETKDYLPAEREVGKITGFLEYEREDRDYEPVERRLRHWREFVLPLAERGYVTQAARCMNCSVPYCMGTGSLAPGTPGCPVNNQIPDWNDLVYNGNWEEAARALLVLSAITVLAAVTGR